MGQEEITSSAKKYFEENEKEYTNNAMLSHFSCLEEGMATHSSILAWESFHQRSLVGYSPWGSKESDATKHSTFIFLRQLAS